MKTKLVSLLTILTISLMGVSGGLAHAAGSGTLALSPNSGTENIGTTFTTDVYENGNGTSVNVVTANLSYDTTQLQYVSSSCGGDFSASAGNTGGNGSVSLNCYVPGGSTAPTDNELVGTVSFKALTGSGSTSISFASTSIMATPSTSPSSNIWNGATTGGSFTLATPVVTPPTTGGGSTSTGSSTTSSGTTASGSTSSTSTGSKTSTSGSTTGASNSSTTASGTTPTSTSSTTGSSNKSSSSKNKHNQRGSTIHGRFVSSTGLTATSYWIIGIVAAALITVILVFRQKLLGTLKTVSNKYSLTRSKQ